MNNASFARNVLLWLVTGQECVQWLAIIAKRQVQLVVQRENLKMIAMVFAISGLLLLEGEIYCESKFDKCLRHALLRHPHRAILFRDRGS